MTAHNFSRVCKTAPNPWQVSHGGVNNPGYSCHMAAMHWAFMTLGMTQIQANAAVGEFARNSCPGCIGNGLHGSVSPTVYGQVFCQSAQRIPSKDQLFSMVNVGDVLITEHKHWPSHTMVVRQKRRPDHITIRGFNNTGTLGTGQEYRYDPVSRNIAKDKYWHDPQHGKFGRNGVKLFVIKHEAYMRPIRILKNKMLG